MNMQLNGGYLTIKLYSINLICQLCVIVLWQIPQRLHLVDES